MANFNKAETLQNNIEAIKIALNLQNRKANEDEIRALKKFSGWGGIPELLYDKDNFKSSVSLSLKNLIHELHDVLSVSNNYNTYIDSIKGSILTSFYTENTIIDAISGALKANDVPVKSYLDPSAGTGRFYEQFKNNDLNISDPILFEKDKLTGLILKSIYGDPAINYGFETISSARNNSFDLVSSNIPFGDFRINDLNYVKSKHKIKRLSTNQIHNYFMLKSLDLLKEGGIMAHIIPYGFLNTPSNLIYRQYLLANSNLISAVRLPNNTFISAGTQAGADLLIIQKNSGKVELSKKEKQLILSTVVIDDLDSLVGNNSTGYRINEYFNKNRENIISDELIKGTDQYGKQAFEYFKSGGSEAIGAELSHILEKDFQLNYQSKIKKVNELSNDFNLFTSEKGQLNLFGSFINDTKFAKAIGDKIISEKDWLTKDYKSTLSDDVIDGQLLEVDGQLVRLNLGNPVTISRLLLTDNEINILYLAKNIREKFLELHEIENRTNLEQVNLRKDVNELYDSFRDNYGDFHKNRRLLEEDTRNKEIWLLEKLEDGKFVKADLFLKMLGQSSLNEYTAKDALMGSLNEFGFADIDYMAKLSNLKKEALITELYAANLIAFNPRLKRYESYSTMISGNVIEKLNWISKHIEDDNYSSFKNELIKTKAQLEEVQPKAIASEQLDFNLGERWIPDTVYENFANELFNTSSIRISYFVNTDNFRISYNKNEKNERIETIYKVAADNMTVNGMDMLEYGLENTLPKMQRIVGWDDVNNKNIYAPDKEKQIDVNAKIEKIRTEFIEFLGRLSRQEKDILAKIYNDKFNCYVKPKYEGNHLTLNDLNLNNLGINALYSSQKDAVWMLMQEQGGIVDHEVGTGKTLTMLIASHEMKRIGTIKKPLLIGMKANIKQIADTYKKAYPNNKILFSGDEDFTKKTRVNMFNKIMANDWDLIIMTHDQFSKIPHSEQAYESFFKEELNNLELDLKQLNSANQTPATIKQLKGLESRKNNLESKLKRRLVEVKENKDEIMNFQGMGIDHIFVDEAHLFKNLTFTTRHNNVAGIGNGKGSDRATFLLVALKSIQEKKGRDLCSTFLSGTPISNSLTELYLLFKYLRPRELKKQAIYNFDSWLATFARKTIKIETSVTSDLIQKERYREFIKVPELALFYSQITDYKSSKMVGIPVPTPITELINLPQSDEQMEYSEKIKKFAQTGDAAFIHRPPLSESEQKAKMLIACNLNKSLALDVRLLDSSKSDFENNKINNVAANIYKYYKIGNHQKATQMVFCDLSTPSSKGDFNVYQAIKEALMARGIPKEEIYFIQNAKTDAKRDVVFKKMNEGKIRVLLGSTQTLGTGVNAQQRVIAMHHIDIPWKPSELEQRVGRGARMGNDYAKDFNNNQVHNFIYATEKTLDAYKFTLLVNKSIFINQIKSNQLGTRKIDDGGMDEVSGMDLAEYESIISGNTDLLQKAKLEREILVLESEKSSFLSDQVNAHARKAELLVSIDKNIATQHSIKNDKNIIEASGYKFDREDIGLALFDFETKERFNTEKELVEYFLEKKSGIETEGDFKLGQYAGLDIICKSKIISTENHDDYFEKKVYLKGTGNQFYEYNFGNMASTTELAFSYFHKCLVKIPVLIESVESNLINIKKNIIDIDSLINQRFSKENKINGLKLELDSLRKKMVDDIQSGPEKALDNNSEFKAKNKGNEKDIENQNNKKKGFKR